MKWKSHSYYHNYMNILCHGKVNDLSHIPLSSKKTNCRVETVCLKKIIGIKKIGGGGGRFWCKTFNFDFFGYVNQLSTKKSVSYFLRELLKMYKKVFKESQTSQAFLSGTHG